MSSAEGNSRPTFHGHDEFEGVAPGDGVRAAYCTRAREVMGREYTRADLDELADYGRSLRLNDEMIVRLTRAVVDRRWQPWVL